MAERSKGSELSELDAKRRARGILATLKGGNQRALVEMVMELAGKEHPRVAHHLNDMVMKCDVLTQPPTENLANVSLLKEGDQCGPFRLEKKLGEGGSGFVYLATRTDDLDFKVALKVLNIVSPKAVKRFRRECNILASLKHPNIAHLIDAGVLPTGQPWMAMEYVEGQNLDVYLERNSLDLRTRLKLFLKICAALSHAHQNLVIHSDIKPSNIMVMANGQPKLLDFGIAVWLDPDTGGQGNQTMLVDKMMTPNYASPEQTNGMRLTAVSDVYSLGVVFYELLTGKRPYDIAGTSMSVITRTINQANIERPSRVGFAEQPQKNAWSKFTSGDLDRIALKALARDTRDRYQSVEALGTDIVLYLKGLPIQARPMTSLYRFRKFAMRNRLALGFATLSFLALSLFTINLQQQRMAVEREKQTSERVTEFLISLFEQIDPDRTRVRDITALEIMENGRRQLPRSLSDEPAVQTRLLQSMGLVYRALGQDQVSIDLLEQALEKVPPDSEKAFSIEFDIIASLMSRGDYQDSIQRLEKTVSRFPEPVPAWIQAHRWFLEGSQLFHIGQYRRAWDAFDKAKDLADLLKPGRRLDLLKMQSLLKWEMGYPDEAIAELERLLVMQRQEFGEVHSSIAWNLLNLAQLELDRLNFERATEQLDAAEHMFQQLFDERHPAYIEYYYKRGNLLLDLEQYSEAEETYRMGMALTETLFDKQHSLYAQGLNVMGVSNFRQAKYDEAESFYRQAMTVYLEVFGEVHPKVAMCLNNLAVAYNAKDDLKGSILLHRQALGLHVQLYGKKHSQAVNDMNNLAAALKDLGNLDEAQELYTEALTISREIFGEDHPKIGIILNNLGDLLYSMSDLRGALEKQREALAIRRKYYGDDHWKIAQSQNNLAIILQRMGNYAEAETALRQALRIWKATYGEQHPELAIGISNLASLLREKGDYPAALDLFQQSLAMREAIYDPGAPSIGFAQWKLGQIKMFLGDYDEALDLLKRAEANYAASLKPGHPKNVRCTTLLGQCYASLGLLEQAETVIRRAIEMGESHLDPGHANLLWANSDLVELHLVQGQVAAAESLLERSMTLEQGSGDAKIHLRLRSLQARVKALQEDHETAEALYTQVIDDYRKLFGRPNPRVGEAYLEFAQLKWVQNRYEDVLQDLSLAEENLAVSLPESHQSRLLVRILEGRALRELGREGGDSLFEESLKRLSRSMGKDHYLVIQARDDTLGPLVVKRKGAL
ncbi:Non-specific serine/threonine protein kinase [Sulfidibacter corallicola]|uniref:Tetratricopeptide repeat protein n=1 Tax=Sulfidibacter corallicola TaxID=2818388 RepID=A0A8A4TNY7_SULCO|nr:serine/threonine-protein kinase [Sulfidibacter corallicola]QTD50611.1 tetratricopeptide repeat protein [Sulfidibacter corallicola]